MAEKIHMDRSTVANLLRLLSLPDTILNDVRMGIMSQRQAMALLPIYELSQTQTLALNQNAAFCEFISLARSGQLNSDTLREKVQIFVDSVEGMNGKQLSLLDDFVTQSEPTPELYHSEPEPTPVLPPPNLVVYPSRPEIVQIEPPSAPAAEYEEPDDVEELPLIAPEPEAAQAAPIVCAQTSTPEPEPMPAVSEKPAVTLAQLQPAQAADNNLVFSITWTGAMAMIGLRKGAGNPVIRAVFGLDDEKIPDILSEMKKRTFHITRYL